MELPAAIYFVPPTYTTMIDPIALAFVNTHSSSKRDRIATLGAWRKWVDQWPGLRSIGHAVDQRGLLTLRAARDDIQVFLRSACGAGPGQDTHTTLVLELAHLTPGFSLRWRAGRPMFAAPPGTAPATVIANYLANAALILLVTGPPLSVCQGRDCLKVFVESRPDRRWCDSTVCGNRDRVSRARSRRLAANKPRVK
jgi:predicted RNA-binding Zn ribbon-like protein